VLGRFDYAHPQMDAPALTAQQQIDQLQGVDRCYFAGAWGGYGFHEDGLTSAIAAVAHLGVQPPWMTPT
jgi:predicted NAD/FAD-binding protein